jgi:hypothetical protein
MKNLQFIQEIGAIGAIDLLLIRKIGHWMATEGCKGCYERFAPNQYIPH